MHQISQAPILEAADLIMKPLLKYYSVEEIEANSVNAVCYTIFSKSSGTGRMEIISQLAKLSNSISSTNETKMDILINKRHVVVKFYHVIDRKYDIWLEIIPNGEDFQIETTL